MNYRQKKKRLKKQFLECEKEFYLSYDRRVISKEYADIVGMKLKRLYNAQKWQKTLKFVHKHSKQYLIDFYVNVYKLELEEINKLEKKLKNLRNKIDRRIEDVNAR